MNYLDNKKIIIMGGGTSAWITALFLLTKNTKSKIILISSEKIPTIGVGEGSTPIFDMFLNNCNISQEEFLNKVKGSFKHGIKFDNWNFDNNYYYHLFDSDKNGKVCDQYQLIINEDIQMDKKILQRKFHGSIFDLVESNKVILKKDHPYAYHFDSSLLVKFLKEKCLEFINFNCIEGKISNFFYDNIGNIDSLKIDEIEENIEGDFFINCLGFHGTKILTNDFYQIKYFDEIIPNNRALTIQIKNQENQILEPYTTSTAQECGWSWKIPQYEKTGYGYVYSDYFINDEDKIYNNLLKTYNLDERSILKSKSVSYKTFINQKQLHKNCINIGLSSGFVEPLEATSIHLSIYQIALFYEMCATSSKLSEKDINKYNKKIIFQWNNIIKFIIFHYLNKNPINDYWKFYKNFSSSHFDFSFIFEKYINDESLIFSKRSYTQVSLGMEMKDDYYFSGFLKEKEILEDIDYLHTKKSTEIRDILQQINSQPFITKKSKLIYT